MAGELEGQVALVTGGSRGIGRACAVALAAAGASVAVNFRDRADSATTVVAAIAAAGGRAIPWHADVADAAACEAMVRGVTERLGRLDILVNNAGTALERLLLDTSVADWDALSAIHLRGMFACTRTALPGMIARRHGRVITVSSIWGIAGAAGEVAYSTVKAGQIGFTKALAKEVGQFGVTVNCVAPGAIDTDMNAGLQGDDLRDWLDRTPVGRLGTPEEVAQVVRFLSGPGAGFITGQVWSPNGGAVI